MALEGVIGNAAASVVLVLLLMSVTTCRYNG